ncbi:unnamed protein product [Urochloa humidicola]
MSAGSGKPPRSETVPKKTSSSSNPAGSGKATSPRTVPKKTSSSSNPAGSDPVELTFKKTNVVLRNAQERKSDIEGKGGS